MNNHVKVVAEERTGGTSYDFYQDGEYVAYYSGRNRAFASRKLSIKRLTSISPYIIQYFDNEDRMVAWADDIRFFTTSPSSPYVTLAKFVDKAIRGRLHQDVTYCCEVAK